MNLVAYLSSTRTFFKKDPKNYFSLIAIIFTILNFIYSCSNQRKQDDKWDNLNLANISLTDARFLTFHQLSTQRARNINWGYKPTLFHTVKDGIFLETVEIPYSLRLVKPGTNTDETKEIPHSNFFFTLSEGINEIKRLSLNEKQYVIMKRYEAQFNFKNIGKTIAKGVQLGIFLLEPMNNGRNDLTSPIDILPDSIFNKTITLWTDINADLPGNLKFEITIKFKDVYDVEQNKKISASYDINRNYWQYGS